MALITSDCGAMRLPEHQMALIASGCVRQGELGAHPPRTRASTQSGWLLMHATCRAVQPYAGSDASTSAPLTASSVTFM